MASAELLPEGLVPKCLEVLRVLSSSERDLFMLVVEIIHELLDAVKPGDDQVPYFRDVLPVHIDKPLDSVGPERLRR
jgi:hypothetical protein